MELRDLRHLVDRFLANAGYPPSDPHFPGPFVLPLMDDRTLGIQWCPDDDEVILFGNPGYTLPRQMSASPPRPVPSRSGYAGEASGKEAVSNNFDLDFEYEYEDDTSNAYDHAFHDAFKELDDHEGNTDDESADEGINLGSDAFGHWVLHVDEESSLTTLCLHVPLCSFGPQEFAAAFDRFRDKFEIWAEALEPTPPIAGKSQDEQPGGNIEPQLALMLRA